MALSGRLLNFTWERGGGRETAKSLLMVPGLMLLGGTVMQVSTDCWLRAGSGLKELSQQPRSIHALMGVFSCSCGVFTIYSRPNNCQRDFYAGALPLF